MSWLLEMLGHQCLSSSSTGAPLVAYLGLADLCPPMCFSTPTFWPVEADAGQPLPPRELVLSNGSLQMPDPGR